MSRKEHHRGIATKVKFPEGTTLEQAEYILKDEGKEVDDYYKDALDCLRGELSELYFYHISNDAIYKLNDTEIDEDGDIRTASNRADGRVDYEVRFYNGGAGFDECIEEAFDKLNK